ncbi:S-adenosyl-L-methionine-dependent methyltransferase [Lactarius quietus]|nr:S-adenosyl-L-methionine-dependent methyltransferase [Lactarius quietus]
MLLVRHRNLCRTLLSRCYVQSSPSPVTVFEKILLDTIKANGPVSYATYLQLCLSHPTEGYYTNPANAIIGARGDFITSPEISQAFGEARDPTGVKHDIQLVELGPGKGTLVDDILRHVHLVESSHSLRAVQQMKLEPWDGKNSLKIHWYDSIDDVPAANGIYTMLVTHEFFDSLRFHLIEKTHQGWKEVLLTSAHDPAAKTIFRPSDPALVSPSLDLSTSTPRTRFRPVLAPEPTPGSTLLGASSPRFASLPIGARIEVSAASFQTTRKLGTLVSEGAGGSTLVVDYGADHSIGNSFRAFKGHALADPFDRPGQADLTANVDFAYLAEVLKGTEMTPTAHGPLSQRVFLLHMGIGTRVSALQRAATSSERADAISEAAARLADPAGIGRGLPNHSSRSSLIAKVR